MNKTKHFKRLWGLMLLLIAMLMPQGAWAANHYDAGYGSWTSTHDADGVKFKITALRMYNYQGNNSQFRSNPEVNILANGKTHTLYLGSLTSNTGKDTFYYNGEGNENLYKGSGSFSKVTYDQTQNDIRVRAYFNNQKNDQKVTTNPDKNYKDNGDGSSKWCTADLTIEIYAHTCTKVTIAGNWGDYSDGINKTESYSWTFNLGHTTTVFQTTPATCAKTGLRTSKCSCGAVTEEVLPKDPNAHNYNANGVCTHDASHFQEPALSSGYYQIANYGNLCWFRDKVNSGSYTINAKQTADITIPDGVTWGGIGGTASAKSFKGIYDGNSCTISGLKITQINTAFFNYTNNATIKNLGLLNVSVSNDGTAGLVVRADNYTTISNCYVTGSAERPLCYTNYGNSTITNCFANVTNGLYLVASNFATITNCYTNLSKIDNGGSGTASNCKASVNAATFASGEIAYLLNSGKTDGTQVWYQKLGNGGNALPTLVKNISNTVYKLEHLKCDGVTKNGSVSYGNSSTAPVDAHSLTATPANAETCTTAGNKAYWTCSTCKKVFSNSTATTETTVAAQTIKALGHSYGVGSWSWADDGHSATCTRTCGRTGCTTNTTGHTSSKSVTLGNGIASAPLVAPNCGELGTTRYTATATVENVEYRDTKDIKDIPVTGQGHTFNEETDPHHTHCTVCDHSFFRYTSSTGQAVNPFNANELKGAGGAKLEFTNTYVDGQGVMEFKKPLVTIGPRAFYNCSNFTGDLTIPNTVTTIENQAFQSCRRLTGNLIIPNSVTSIGNNAFGGCQFRGNLIIPNSVTSIGGSAFSSCNFSGNLILPSSVISIGRDAFMFCNFNNITLQSIPKVEDRSFFHNDGYDDENDIVIDINFPITILLSGDSYVYKGYNPDFPEVASVTAPCTLDLTDSAVEKHPNLTHTGGIKIEEKDAAHLVSSNCITDTYHYSCNLCHKNLPATYTAAGTGAHNYTEESDAEAYLATAASCGTDATYFYKCANCTEHNSETWTKAGTRGHHYVDGHCSVCGDASGPMTVTLENGEVRKYNSLQQAIDDIVGLFGGYDITLTLHQDLTLEGNEDIYIIFHERGDDFNFTIDLNGHTITGSREERNNNFYITNSESGLPTLTIANSCQDKKGKLFNCCLDINENTKVIVSEGVSIYPIFEKLGFVNFHSATSSLVNYGDLYGDVVVDRGASFINHGRVAHVLGEFENHGGYCAYFNWANDGSSFSAYVNGLFYDYNEEVEDYSITSEVTKEPTCSEPGVRTFTGSFIGDTDFGTQEFTDTKEVEIPATGHHTFAASDITHDVCTVCNHGFLRYEADSQQNPYKAENLKDKGDNTLTIVSHTFDEDNWQGVMEFNAPLVKIGDLAFLGSDIKGITIPNTVVTIGTSAFVANHLISAIEIPNSVKIIGSSAFADCIALTKITLGSSVEKINGYAFSCDEDQSDKDFDITLKSLPQFVNCDYPEIFHYKCIYYDEYVGCVGVEDRPIPANFELDDNSYVAPESSLGSSCIADHVTYTRIGIKNQWGTIVVPFEVNGSGHDYDLYTLSSVSGDKLALTKVTGRLAAGTPALIRINSEQVNGKTYDLTLRAVSREVDAGGTLTSTPAPSTGSEQALALTGSYSVKDITEEEGYIISNNKFWDIQAVRGTNSVYCAPFRAYLAGTPSSDAKALSIGISEEADAMEAITAITEGEAEYFDLNGRKLNSLQTGVNIVKYSNGKTKKVIVK
ncbi:MAG: leucine-rich repeat protein [Bacteroidales bacterium]|nr:leucine-rich repeat protein [Bacteroidales bacterium]